MSTRATAKNSSAKDETVKPEAKQADANKAKRCSDKREFMRVAREGAARPTKIIFENRLLYLTIPHLSYAVQDQAERNQKGVLIACDNGWNAHRNPSHDKRYSPLRMIAQFFGIHKQQPAFAEIQVRFHLQSDGSFWQEAILPPGWVVVETCSGNYEASS